MRDSTFWRESGELPGVFNWALAGLMRLRARGRFDEPTVCKQHREEYKLDSNPAKAFLLEYCEADLGGKVSKTRLYQEYRSYCGESGFTPLSKTNLSKEVPRVFASAKSTEHATMVYDMKDECGLPKVRGERDREWRGIKLRDER